MFYVDSLSADAVIVGNATSHGGSFYGASSGRRNDGANIEPQEDSPAIEAGVKERLLDLSYLDGRT